MYTILFIILPVVLIQYGNHFYTAKSKIGQREIPVDPALVPVRVK